MSKKKKEPNNAVGYIILVSLGLWLLSLPIIKYFIGLIFIFFIFLFFTSKKNTNNQSQRISNNTATKTSITQAQVNRELEIVADCVKILNESCNLDTVLHRYKLLIEVLTRLKEYEKNRNISFDRELPSDVLVRIKKEEASIMNEAVDRAYEDMIIKSNKLKTEKGKQDRKDRFFEGLAWFMVDVPFETQEYINELTLRRHT